MKLKKSIFSFLLILAGFSSFAKIKFGEADINQNDEILYTIKNELPGTYVYRSLFKAKIKNGEINENPALLTCFPEQMERLCGGSIIQIRNRYGIAWLNMSSASLEWKEYSSKIPVNSMRLSKMNTSPDGEWICFTEKTGYATGKLYLKNVNSGKVFLLDENASFNYENVPVKWLSDSSVMVYAKNGNIYFCNPSAVSRGVEVSEEFRKIGPGTINSVNWADGKYLVYIDSDLVYRISSKELYTLGLYSGIIGKGQTVGRLPAQFKADKDTFSVNNDVSAMVLIQNSKIFTYFKINRNTCEYLDIVYSGPYVDMNASLLESEIIWSNGENPIIWMRRLPYNGKKIMSSVYRLDERLSKFLEISSSGKPVLSPDGNYCAFYAGSSVYAYDINTWKRINKIETENVVSLLWENNSNLIIGGDRTISRWPISDSKLSVLALSSAENGYWNEQTGEVTADIGSGKLYVLSGEQKTWKEESLTAKINKDSEQDQTQTAKTETNFSENHEPHKNVLRNGRYRVFCGETPNPFFENALYIRTLSGKAVTRAAYPESVKKVPESKKVALIFDAYDNADGLTNILYTLNRYLVSGTFFLNGEFIRRYPNETNQIALSRNECASMFFSTAKLTQPGFILNEDYIRRGLARNEDEFNIATGKELSLMWHAPEYDATEKIIQDGKKAGYEYVSPRFAVFDNVTLEQAVSGKGKYLSPGKLIDFYMKMLESGEKIIPVTVGISRGTRESYLYDNLDLLLSAILDAGYEIVPLRYVLGE